ncbi:MAG TPA: GTP-binding protein [Lichenihabitans sp.]|nr:GTP-binding protein [Lichenihabitans sp.]
MTGAGAPVPLLLLTGFLGAGKTTLMNRLLREPALGRSAVVVNEFGHVGIDHLLVERVDGDHLLLSTGCICCAARGDLVSALIGLLDCSAGTDAGFDRIIVETTGLADPRPILDALLLDPDLRARCRLAAVLTVVDARDGLGALSRGREAARQVALADALVLSKLDLGGDAGEAGAARLAAHLAGLNPLAPIIDGRDIDAVVTAVRGRGGRVPMPRSAAEPERRSHRHVDVEAVVLRAGLVDARTVDAFLHILLQRHGSHLLRLKGFVATTDDPSRPHHVQVVGARLHPGLRQESWPDSDRTTRLVVIVEGMPAGAVAELWDDMFGPPAIDRPDATALMQGRHAAAGLF